MSPELLLLVDDHLARALAAWVSCGGDLDKWEKVTGLEKIVLERATMFLELPGVRHADGSLDALLIAFLRQRAVRGMKTKRSNIDE